MYHYRENEGLSGLGKKLGLSKKWRRNLQSLSLSKQLGWAKNKAKAKAADAALVARAEQTRQAAIASRATAEDVARIRAMLPTGNNFAPPGANAPANLPPVTPEESESLPLPLILAGVGVLGFLLWKKTR